MKIVGIVFSLILLSGCATTKDAGLDFLGEDELGNICYMFDQKLDWSSSLSAVEKQYGVPPNVIMAIMHQESRFKHDARPLSAARRGLFGSKFASSAYGYSQALDETWYEYQIATDRPSSSRESFFDSAQFIGWYIDKSAVELGISRANAAEHYLAYHEGRSGFKNGTYKQKTWLMTVAKKVGKQSTRYSLQYEQCPFIDNTTQNFFVRYFL